VPVRGGSAVDRRLIGGSDAVGVPKRFESDITLLADPTRREIVALVGRGVRRPNQLAIELGLSRPAISRQLRLLLLAGILDRRRHPGDGRGISYFIDPLMAVPIVAWLAGTGVGRPPPDPDRLI